MEWTSIGIETVFAVGLFVNAALFIPQIIRLFREKDSKELSLITFAGFNIIQLFTILHGLLRKDVLLATGNLTSLITCGAVTTLIVYYRIKRRQQPESLK